MPLCSALVRRSSRRESVMMNSFLSRGRLSAGNCCRVQTVYLTKFAEHLTELKQLKLMAATAKIRFPNKLILFFLSQQSSGS